MLKVIIKIFVLCAILFTIDRFLGYRMEYYLNHVESGPYYKTNYLKSRATDPILVMGSSRAYHHYNPNIIEKELNRRCFNCGTNGMGIILMYGRLLLLLNRYHPDVIIYDVHPEFDIMIDDKTKYISYLAPYYDLAEIKSIIDAISSNEKYKQMSYLYRYNSRFMEILSAQHSANTDSCGYSPLAGEMAYDPTINEDQAIIVDSVKIKFLKLFAKTCKDKHIKLIFCVSPRYKAKDINSFKPIEIICKEFDIPFVNYYGDSRFDSKSLYFDSGHLNSKGSNMFSSVLSDDIKQYINIEK